MDYKQRICLASGFDQGHTPYMGYAFIYSGVAYTNFKNSPKINIKKWKNTLKRI